jgi:hypothetical protein
MLWKNDHEGNDRYALANDRQIQEALRPSLGFQEFPEKIQEEKGEAHPNRPKDLIENFGKMKYGCRLVKIK